MACKPKKYKSVYGKNKKVDKIKLSNTERKQNTMYFVHLRQSWNSKDSRPDPIFDEGTFGSTGCHKTNLLNPNKISRLKKGDRFVFLQGGKDEKTDASTIKLSFITPPIINVELEGKKVVIKWSNYWNKMDKRPLKYKYQTNLLEKANIKSFTEKEKKYLKIINPKIFTAKRSTKASKISSCTRSLCRGVDLKSRYANNLIKFYEKNIRIMKTRYGNKAFVSNNSEAR